MASSPNVTRYNEPDGQMDEIHELRKQYGADLVALIAYLEPAGGEASDMGLTSGMLGNAEAYGFSVNTNSGSNADVIAHEFGHNLGLAHSINQTEAPMFVIAGAFQESNGYQSSNGDSIATIMAYGEAGVHLKIPYFSSPTMQFDGKKNWFR